MTKLRAGDVVVVELGYLAKTRPCVILAAQPDPEREIAIVAPLTTQVRGGRTEIAFPKPRWLNQPGVLNLCGIAGVEHARLERFLGVFPSDKFELAKRILAEMFGLESGPAQPTA